MSWTSQPYRYSIRYQCILMIAVAGLALDAGSVVTGNQTDSTEPSKINFITRRGDQLFDGDRQFRFISFNIPNLMVIEDAYEFTKPNPWRWPNEFELNDALESIRQLGGHLARTYVVSVYRAGSDMGDFVHVLGPGKFNEEAFRSLDKLIEIAGRKGVRLVIPLVDQHKWWGGIGEYAAFRGKPIDEFWADRQLINDFQATVEHIINRQNSFTGIAYRDDPTIFGWETGNEISSTPEWTREIAQYIKDLDPNHLVIDGKSLHCVPVWSLDDPNIDVLTTHHYPWGNDHDYVKPIRAAHALTKGKKAYFVGEFGFVETPHIANALDTVIDNGISGAVLWSLRMHRREGGFYWHMEVGTGRNIFKAYHWPGFASGDRYDERTVMALMREKAHTIRGLSVPPLESPAAPKLLPIEKTSAISWQGSAGASSYDVLRADVTTGPWMVVAKDISDADVQYRPLFNDAGVDPGKAYFYRVVARNSAGDSPPSNVVGPVAVDRRTLVDECRDLSAIETVEGRVSLADENARQFQEDCHRLALQTGSAVIYRVPGSISEVRAYLFVRDSETTPIISISTDGKDYTPLDLKRHSFRAGKSVYGYLEPVLLKVNGMGKMGKYVRIMAPTHDGASQRDEKHPPFELSRMEIDYDHHSVVGSSPR